jgi:hypothetical protein
VFRSETCEEDAGEQHAALLILKKKSFQKQHAYLPADEKIENMDACPARLQLWSRRFADQTPHGKLGGSLPFP